MHGNGTGRRGFRRSLSFLVILAALAMHSLADSASADSKTWSYELRVPEGDGPFPVVIFLPGCTGYGPVEVRVETMPGAYHSSDLDMGRFVLKGVGGADHIVEGNPAASERSHALYLDWLAAHL